MSTIDTETLLKTYRKRPIIGNASSNVHFDRSDIARILPHRDPILLVDSIDYVDVDTLKIRGSRTVPENDPVFSGHFPGTPIYPGTSVIEMIGQLSLCLYYFLQNNRKDIASDAEPAPVRATKILGAHFLAPILPGDEVTLEAIGLEDDGFFARAAGQAIVNGTIACITIGEVCFV